jgi:hypothetical protein
MKERVCEAVTSQRMRPWCREGDQRMRNAIITVLVAGVCLFGTACAHETSPESARIEPGERVASLVEQSQVLQGEPPSGEIHERGIVPKLSPSATAAPAPTGMAPPPPGPLLPSPDFELAFYHAPIHYQDTNRDKAHADYITRFIS